MKNLFFNTDYFTDAPMNSRNNCCGRFGRDLNSGWNWHATKNFFSGSSMISTKRSSGEVPENTSPAASIGSRYSLLNS